MTKAMDEAAERALAAYDFGDGARLEPLARGLINNTYVVRAPDGERRAVLQRLHPIFAAEVHLDIAAVTAHIAARGLITPRIVPTTSGALWTTVSGRTWRALTYVDGACLDAVPDDDTARAAGELVGRFHAATSDFTKPLAFARTGVHDTEGHLRRLGELVRGEPENQPRAAITVGTDILAVAEKRTALSILPSRLCHGDLKISNLVFTDGAPRIGKCLIDLDTLGRQSIATELGDALRSWCNPYTEDHPGAHIEISRYRAALEGYARGAGALLAGDEIAAIPSGLETICVELAARFCIDAFEDHYFGWDASRFSSRRDHNLARARGQLALAQSVITNRAELEKLARSIFHGAAGVPE